MNNITEIINQFGLLAGIIVSIGTFLLSRTDAAVKNTKEIQAIYETSFKEFEARYKAELIDKDKEHAEDMNRMRRSMEDEAREKQGELLVKINDLEQRNTDLKVQVAQLGGMVQGVTGVRIYQWSKPDEGTK